jgi:hypothetical protein
MFDTTLHSAQSFAMCVQKIAPAHPLLEYPVITFLCPSLHVPLLTLLFPM